MPEPGATTDRPDIEWAKVRPPAVRVLRNGRSVAGSDRTSGPATGVVAAVAMRLAQHNGFVQLAPELDETDEGMSRDDFALLEQVEDHHFWFVTRNELITWLTRRFASNARQVLEIGCGTGFVTGALQRALPDARIAGSELHTRGSTHGPPPAREPHRTVSDGCPAERPPQRLGSRRRLRCSGAHPRGRGRAHRDPRHAQAGWPVDRHGTPASLHVEPCRRSRASPAPLPPGGTRAQSCGGRPQTALHDELRRARLPRHGRGALPRAPPREADDA